MFKKATTKKYTLKKCVPEANISSSVPQRNEQEVKSVCAELNSKIRLFIFKYKANKID